MAYRFFQMKFHLFPVKKLHEKVAHLLGIIAFRKYAAAPFHLGGKAPAVEKGEQVFIVEFFIGTV